MPKRAKELSAAQVRKLSRPGIHAVGGCSGLVLQVKESGAKSWLLRSMTGGRRRAFGLGAFPDVGLAEAREKARTMKDKIREGIDPAEERREARAALVAANESRHTFDEAARQYLAAKRHEFRNPKHAKQWESTLKTYASPVIGSMPVHEIELDHIVRILEPIWYEKTETAARLRGRIENVVAYATTRGWRKGDNPARWRGHLSTVLPQPNKVKKVEHFKALPFTEVGAFMASLREREGIAARALEFTVLTACRSGEVRGATWDEIDVEAAEWRIPAERMKSGREHRVPLSDAALEVLKAAPRLKDCPYVFASAKGNELSDAAMSAVLKRMKVNATVHGIRSTFRDWCAEMTAYPHEVVEMSLAHVIPDKVERAYRRGSLFKKRRRLMDEWAKYCATVQESGEVVAIGEALHG